MAPGTYHVVGGPGISQDDADLRYLGITAESATAQPPKQHAINGASHSGAGNSVTRNVGTGAGDVAAGNAPAAAQAAAEATAAADATSKVGTHAALTATHGVSTIADQSDARFPTADEKAALAGTSGTPGAANKFVTNADSRNSDSRVPTAHDIDGANHNAATTANFNTKLTDGKVMTYDATLDLYYMAGSTAGFTGTGGVAKQLTNKTGAASVKGTVVSLSTSTAQAFMLQADEYDMVGVVLEAGVADGSPCWIVTHGPVQALLEDGTGSTVGNWVHAATTDGRADASLSAPSGGGFVNASEHFKEMGHCLETKTSGTSVLCWILIHFN